MAVVLVVHVDMAVVTMAVEAAVLVALDSVELIRKVEMAA
jgi:hypothetical protein